MKQRLNTLKILERRVNKFNPTENRAAQLVRGTVPPVVGPLD